MAPLSFFRNQHLHIFRWYWLAEVRQLVEREHDNPNSVRPQLWSSPKELFDLYDDNAVMDYHLEVGSIKLQEPSTTHLQRNAASTRDFTRLVLKPLVVVVKINGHAARALLDSGSLGDFISTSLTDQLRLKKETLAKPIPLHLAVQGSRSVVNCGTKVQLEYQGINETQYFDVANLHNYDIILGTPFLFQHEVLMGLNNSCVIIGSNISKPIEGLNVNKLSSRALDIVDADLDKI
jgi:hypothetical protein